MNRLITAALLLFALTACGQPADATQMSLMPPPWAQFTDNNGLPLAGGQVYTCQPGTSCGPGSTTFKSTYTDSTGASANADPVVLDSTGRANIWLTGFYKISVYDQFGSLIRTADNVSGGGGLVPVTLPWVDASKYANLQAAASAIGSTIPTVLYISTPQTVAVSTVLTSNIQVVDLVTGLITINSGQTLTINGPFSAGSYQVFAGSGVVSGLIEARPEWFGTGSAAFSSSVNSIIPGGVVLLQAAVYPSPYVTGSPLTKDDVKIKGTKQPSFKTDYTALEGGSIIQGSFFVTAHNFEISDVGVDAGTALGGAASGAFAIYDNGNGVYWRGFKATNLTALCQNPTAAVHAALFEHLDGAQISNIKTVYGTHGIAFKGIHSSVRGLWALGSSSNGIIIKSSVEGGGGATYLDNFDDLYTGSTTGKNGGGIRLTAQEGVAMSQINISNVATYNTSFGIVFSSTPTDYILSTHISNFSLLAASGNGIEIDGRTSKAQFSNGSVDTCAGEGVVTSSYAMDTDFVNVTASNNIDGFILYGIHDSLTSCRAINNTNNGFYTKTDLGATSYTDLCSGSGNGLSLFGHDSTGKFQSNMITATYAPTFQNGWVAFGAGNSTPQYWKDSSGAVHLQGLVKSGTVGSAIFTLPADFCPPGNLRFTVSNNGLFGEVVIGTAGGVALTAGSNAYVSLDGISFMH